MSQPSQIHSLVKSRRSRRRGDVDDGCEKRKEKKPFFSIPDEADEKTKSLFLVRRLLKMTTHAKKEKGRISNPDAPKKEKETKQA